MKADLFKMALDISQTQNVDRNVPIGAPVQFGMKKINGRGMSYTERFRDQWVKPEYDLEEIQIAQEVIQKLNKSNNALLFDYYVYLKVYFLFSSL